MHGIYTLTNEELRKLFNQALDMRATKTAVAIATEHMRRHTVVLPREKLTCVR